MCSNCHHIHCMSLPRDFVPVKMPYSTISKNHKLSESAHQEIMAMTHSDEKVSYYFFKREMEITAKISNYLEINGFSNKNLTEKVHVMIGMIDNLCHEIVYHKHEEIDYDVMKKIVIENILTLFK